MINMNKIFPVTHIDASDGHNECLALKANIW